MKPAWSIILFTTIAGAAQGLAVALAVATWVGVAPAAGTTAAMLGVAAALLVVALAASFFHLGHPLRAWRAALMWRTSWMSREVIVLPAFIALVALWALAARGVFAADAVRLLMPALVVAGALLLWICTAMIYACIRFVQEWAHPLTLANYVLIGLSSGLVLAGALSVAMDEGAFARQVAPWAVAVTGIAWLVRAVSLRRNAGLRLKSTLQSATGIASPRIAQKSMGMTGGSFNTREFFHGATLATVRGVKAGFQVLGFAAPMLLVLLAAATGREGAWLAALALQACGVLAERWFFFAQARHPQNLYYQVVS